MNQFNYFTEVEETFIRRRGKHLFISPRDWALIDSWKERNIPLHIAIRAIENVFDGVDARNGNGTISTLSYCANAVEEQFAEWRTSQVGKSSDFVEAGMKPIDIKNHIVSLIETLMCIRRTEIKDDLDRAIQRLTGIGERPSTNYETTDGALCDIEQMLDTAMLTKWERDEFEQVETSIHKQLEPYKSQMEEDAYSNTFNLMLLKKLREISGIPRMGLFYL